MPLSPSSNSRRRLHVRHVSYEGWQREDGLFDIEARVVDTKDHDFPLASGLRRMGEPVHDIWARITIDPQFNVHAIETSSDWIPYPGGCDDVAPGYAKLVGANLMDGFRQSLYDAAGGVRGCTHLTELIAFLPTAAVQTFASLRHDVGSGEQMPFQLDRCHALETSSTTVRRYYPKWYRGPG